MKIYQSYSFISQQHGDPAVFKDRVHGTMDSWACPKPHIEIRFLFCLHAQKVEVGLFPSVGRKVKSNTDMLLFNGKAHLDGFE